MSIISVTQIYDNEQATESTDEITRTDVYQVVVDDASDYSTSSVLNASDGDTTIPAKTATDGNLKVKTKRSRRDAENPNVFTVEVDWSDQYNPADAPETGGEKWNLDVAIDGLEYTETIYRDVDGNPIINQAGQFFDPTVEETFYDEQITISFDTDQVDQTNIKNCRGKINSAAVTMNINGYRRTFAAKKLLLRNARQRATVEAGSTIWSMDYEFIYREDGWNKKVLNLGFNWRDGDKLVKCKDRDGLEVNSPVVLLGDGTQAPADAEVLVLEFVTKKAVSFSGLFTGL